MVPRSHQEGDTSALTLLVCIGPDLFPFYRWRSRKASDESVSSRRQGTPVTSHMLALAK